MSLYLGIDTSNYTTSAAVVDTASGKVLHRKQLLPVSPGTLGLKQSDAVFAHVKQLPHILEELFFSLQQNLPGQPLCGVGVSTRPRDVEHSYMPCFLAGDLSARSIAAANHIPRFAFSHQCGHIAAALYSSRRMELLEREFIAFHFSGGTTECLHVSPDPETVFRVQLLSTSLDLKCGQLIDRVGGMLGLSFPAGRELEPLAQRSDKRYRPRIPFREGNCCISGLENQCRRMVEENAPPEDVAAYCIQAVAAVAEGMTQQACGAFPGLPLLYAGGVMSNAYLRERLTRQFGGSFAAPEFSADNAAGIALLAARKGEGYGA